MIEDKEIGLKIAENPAEALWENAKKACEARIKSMKESLIIEQAFLELCLEKKAEAVAPATVK